VDWGAFCSTTINNCLLQNASAFARISAHNNRSWLQHTYNGARKVTRKCRSEFVESDSTDTVGTEVKHDGSLRNRAERSAHANQRLVN
jgi:hypothetical protein